ncbi:DUF309 domain-containing protein [Desulforhopalus singaporensis]|uniref:DUF309 domain-containing protein n=1 Tax=Desulforhopalus singaporensis TaxID=91360 RepID=A0A1H0JBE9_9BACT|nr:DUF309 domain-containing protein [Desulforhopalus singaporensis]SDO40833.1 protein of unknown function [Desulforhopalus singaporensis]
MDDLLFNPFEDRLSRDIRNDLSEGLVKAVETGDTEIVKKTVAFYQEQSLADCYTGYINTRHGLYLQALEKISGRESDPIAAAVILWNLQLFFEVHEILEHAWYDAQGQLKETLQALIRAAGVYIKREYGFNDSAQRIAAKAIPVLQANTVILEKYFDPVPLINILGKQSASPPVLEPKKHP